MAITLRRAIKEYLRWALKRHQGGAVWVTRLASYFWSDTWEPVRRANLRENIDGHIDYLSVQVREAAEALGQEQMSLGGFQALMSGHIKDGWRASYIAGRGGVDRMTQADWGWLGAKLRDEYRYLDGFSADIAAGKLSPKQIAARADLYAKAPWTAYQEGDRKAKIQAGHTEERRRSAGDNNVCGDCADYESQGWQPVGTLPAPGEHCACGRNCRCGLEYRGAPIMGGARGEKPRRPMFTDPEVEEMIRRIEQEGGFTYNVATRQYVHEGYVFAPRKITETPIAGATTYRADLVDYADKYPELFVKALDPHKQAHLGPYKYEGQWYLDVSRVYEETKENRKQVSLICKLNDQNGFFRLSTGEWIDNDEEFRKLWAEPYFEKGVIMSEQKKAKKYSVQRAILRMPTDWPEWSRERKEQWMLDNVMNPMREADGEKALTTEEQDELERKMRAAEKKQRGS